jgi:translation initiation factor IF-3
VVKKRVINKPYIKKQEYGNKRRDFVQANYNIRFPQVRVLTERGESLGVMSSQEALQKAREAETDLVVVTEKANPPVVKIIELSKFKYQLQQKEAEQRKSAKGQELKEVRFTPFMGDQDFETRLKKVTGFIEKGNKVRLSLMFKGRAIASQDLGYEIFNRVFTRTSEIAKIEIEPKLLGKKLIAQLSPEKKK